MKNLKTIYTTAIMAFAGLLLSSCQQEEELVKPKQEVQFSFVNPQPDGQGNSSGRLAEDEDIRYVYITIKNAAGEAIYAWHTMELYKFGDNYITQPVTLEEGDYTITNFVIMNSKFEFIYATPLEGRRISYLVRDPLPIHFSVTKDKVNTVAPEVLPIDLSSDAADYGFSIFSFESVDVVHGYIAVFILNDWDTYVLADATMEIYAAKWQEPLELIAVRELQAKNNLVPFSRAYNQYKLRITRGDHVYEKTLSITELGNLASRPLKVIFE